MTKMRDLAYNDRLPEMVMDSLMEFISTLLVNFKIVVQTPTSLRVPAGTVNDQVGAGIMGRWRYNTANADAAHPGGAAGTHDVWLTAADNNFAPSGAPPGSSPETDSTVYTFALAITTTGAAPVGPALSRKVAQVVWDGTKITRVIPVAGNLPLTITDFAVLTPEVAGRNTIQSAGNWVPMIFKKLAAQTADLAQWQDDTGASLVRVTVEGVVMPAAMTQTARDAIPAGRRPPGGILFNSTTGQHNANVGTDAAPVWVPLGGYGAGIILDFAGDERDAPPRTTTADGHQIDKTVEPGLWNRLSRSGTVASPWDTFGGLPAPGAGFFRSPDLRGRSTVGKKDMGALVGTTPPTLTGAAVTRAAAATLGALFGEEFHTLTIPEMPSHDHGAATGTPSANHTHSGTTGIDSPDHTHAGTTATDSPDHAHVYDAPNLTGAGSGSSDSLATPAPGANTSGATARHTHTFTTGGRSANHSHAFTSGIESVTHTHPITAQGGGGAHENVFPVAVVNKLVTL